MPLITTFIIFSIVLFNICLYENWQLQRSGNNIKVYSRPIANTGLRELKAITSAEVPLSNLLAIIKDVEYYPSWVYRCSEAKILNKVSENEFYYYQKTFFPWPLSNRDIVIHVKISQNKNSGEITVKLDGVPDYIEKKAGLVRVRKFAGKWVLTPKDDGKINIVHELFIETKGEIPPWLIDYAAVEGPYSTMYKMVSLVKNKRFSNK